MLNEFIKEQCEWRRIRREEKVEYTLLFPKNEQLRTERYNKKVNMILAGKNFDEFDNHEAIIHASLFLPFVIIFITQIYIPMVKNGNNIGLLNIALFALSFLSFAMIVKNILDVRFNSEYKIPHFSIILMFFLYTSFFSLYLKPIQTIGFSSIVETVYELFRSMMDLNRESILNFFHGVWKFSGIPVVILFLSIGYYKVRKKSSYLCSDNSTVLLFGTMVTMFIAAVLVPYCTEGIDNIYLLPSVLYIFYFFLAYQHHRYLILIKENSDEVEALRLIVSGGIEDDQDINSSTKRGYANKKRDFF